MKLIFFQMINVYVLLFNYNDMHVQDVCFERMKPAWAAINIIL